MANDREWKDHKYYAKIPQGKNFRYFYTKAEYNAFKKPDLANFAKNAISKTGKFAEKIVKNTSEVVKKTASDIKSNIDSKIEADKNERLKKEMAIAAKRAHDERIAKQGYSAEEQNDWNNPSHPLLNKVPKKSSKGTPEEDMAAVNPNYDMFDAETTMNCVLCTATYDLRRRGYDVSAHGDTNGEDLISTIETYYNVDSYEDTIKFDSKCIPLTSKIVADNLNSSLIDEGDGARGHLYISWSQGGAHDIVWEVSNGEVVYRDCQNNTSIKQEHMMFYLMLTNGVAAFRVDDLEIRDPAVRAISTAAKYDKKYSDPDRYIKNA